MGTCDKDVAVHCVDSAAGAAGTPTTRSQRRPAPHLVRWHSDTLVAGPMSATAMVDSATKP